MLDSIKLPLVYSKILLAGCCKAFLKYLKNLISLMIGFAIFTFAARLNWKCNLLSLSHKNNFPKKLKSHRLFACLTQWCKMNFNQTNNLTSRWIFAFPYFTCSLMHMKKRWNFSPFFFLFWINQQCRYIMKSFALFS